MWKYSITGAFILVLVTAGVIWYIFRPVYEPETALAYIDSIALYEEFAQAQAEYTNRPGQGDNQHRQKLHVALTTILTKEDMDDSDRLTIAQDALINTDAIRAEIDLASASREKVEGAIKDVSRQHTELTSPKLQNRSLHIIDRIEHKQEIVADIIATMYAVNGQTEGIIKTIAENNGALTDGHIQQINQETNDAEARFDRLTELYEQLEVIDVELHTAYKEFADMAL